MSERITTERLRELIALHRAPFICGRGHPDGCGYCPTCKRGGWPPPGFVPAYPSGPS